MTQEKEIFLTFNATIMPKPDGKGIMVSVTHKCRGGLDELADVIVASMCNHNDLRDLLLTVFVRFLDRNGVTPIDMQADLGDMLKGGKP